MSVVLLTGALALGPPLGVARAQETAREQDNATTLRRSDERFNDRSVPNPIVTVTPAQVANSPLTYLGKTVRLTGRIGDTSGPHVLRLRDVGDRRSAEVIVLVPVLTPYAMGIGPRDLEGERVTVEGTVRSFHRLQFEEDYPWFSINLFHNGYDWAHWNGRPVIVAHSVRTPPGRELVDREASGLSTGARGTDGPWPTTMSARGVPLPVTDLHQILRPSDPDQLLRTRVVLDNVQLQRVLNPRWIMVGTARERQVLVQLPRARRDVRIGDTVHISGVVRRIPASPATIWLRPDQIELAEQQELYVDADWVDK